MHPNKRDFLGILTFADTPSDSSPSGARGHKIVVSRATLEASRSTLIGMGVNYSGTARHSAREKCGVITSAWLDGDELMVAGYVYPFDFPDLLQISASAEELGMSFEVHNAHVTDMRAAVWELNTLCFVGAAIIPRGKTAWRKTEFVLL